MASAKKEGRGTITFNWTPNFTDADGFAFIEWPPYYPGCRKQDGGDSKCGSPKGWLKKAANYKFPNGKGGTWGKGTFRAILEQGKIKKFKFAPEKN